jgi:hypothetical protein
LNFVLFAFQNVSQLKPPRRLVKQTACYWKMLVRRPDNVDVMNQLLTNKLRRAFRQLEVTVNAVFTPFARTAWALNVCRLLWCDQLPASPDT